jgi:hypothetical protein
MMMRVSKLLMDKPLACGGHILKKQIRLPNKMNIWEVLEKAIESGEGAVIK